MKVYAIPCLKDNLFERNELLGAVRNGEIPKYSENSEKSHAHDPSLVTPLGIHCVLKKESYATNERALLERNITIYSQSELGMATVGHFRDYDENDDVTRIHKYYQLYRNNYTFDYIIESSFPPSFFASKSNEKFVNDNNDNNSSIQNFNLNLNISLLNTNFSRTTRAIINQLDKRHGDYQVIEFFYKNDSISYYNSLVTSISHVKNTWPAIVEISFKTSGRSLEPSAVEACDFRLIFDRKGFFKDFDGYIERKCNRVTEYHFYLVSQVEGNTDLGLKFFQGESMFALISNKLINREMRDVVVEDESPFPSLIPTLYVIYYDYFKMKRQARDITRIPNNYQLLRDKLNPNNFIIQSTSTISPYNATNKTIQDTPLTIRAIIKAIEYPSGKYYVQEFFYETNAIDYSYALTTANLNIQDKWPAVVEINFTSSGIALDPYSLEVCNFRLIFSKNDYYEDIVGHIERRCPKMFEYSFYPVSRVEVNNDIGLKFFQDGSEFATISSKAQVREKRDITSRTGYHKNSQLRWNSWFWADYKYIIESSVYIPFIISDEHKFEITNNNTTLDIKLTDDKNNSFFTPNHTSLLNNDDNPLTIRANIDAVQYNSGYYKVQEFFYKPGSQDYFKTLITASATVQSLSPGIVEISFSTSDKVLDPYTLEACEYKLFYFEELNGQIERRCKRALEDDFYMISKVSGSTYWGLEFTFGDNNSNLSARTSEVDYWPSPRRRDVIVYDDTPFPPIIPALYSVYYDYVQKNR
ncbi:6793_t:CDS:2 [Scutellospora calospora]|uniref:6793_t:CDS:1 n=1 Tax=Scutellospora calospora TaxID=85575 RepID=A0ACA9JTZ8_9GLOM|nr:6793_t:CDS:2 [Scutellospora calospora]